MSMPSLVGHSASESAARLGFILDSNVNLSNDPTVSACMI